MPSLGQVEKSWPIHLYGVWVELATRCRLSFGNTTPTLRKELVMEISVESGRQAGPK